MNLRHPLRQLLRQVTPAEMYIKKSGLDALMARKLGDLMKVPVGSREISQTKMPRSMCGELSDTAPLRNALHDLRPCPNGDGSAPIAP